MESKLKITSFLCVLFINFLSGTLFWAVFIKSGIKVFDLEFWKNGSFVFMIVLFLEILALYLLFQLKKIVIEKDKIIFKNPIFPFLKKERKFSYYDFSKIVDEKSKTVYYEALWLFKNGKLENQISSYYYSNYTKLKFEIKIQHKGKLEINSFKQIHCKFGGKL